ncbi:MAG: hypothetical protein JWO40_709 [Candidatus Doudnabacteria bacterium]|nr:hypothetical protein [Candidatus Doudnabacteria bacterium]
MDKLSNLALIVQMIDSAEKNIRSAKQLLKEMMGGKELSFDQSAKFTEKAQMLSVSDGGKVVEGVFDGQNMIGPDGKQYPVPANYASKSKLIEGDVLKLTISEDGSFIYKQIGPIERRKIIGLLTKDDKGDHKIIADGKAYKVLLASLTYFKADVGDQVTIVVPKDSDSNWAAVENVIKNPGDHPADFELNDDSESPKRATNPEEHEMDEV